MSINCERLVYIKNLYVGKPAFLCGVSRYGVPNAGMRSMVRLAVVTIGRRQVCKKPRLATERKQ